MSRRKTSKRRPTQAAPQPAEVETARPMTLDEVEDHCRGLLEEIHKMNEWLSRALAMRERIRSGVRAVSPATPGGKRRAA